MNKQRGFINLDGLVTVFYLAAIGIVAIVGFAGYGLYKLAVHLLA